MPPETPTTDPKPAGDTPATPPAAGTPAAPPPAPDTKPSKVEPKEGKPAGEGAPAPKTPKKLSADDDDLPEDDELVQLSPKALKARLARASKAQLKDAFGTDDLEEIKTKLAQADEYTKKKEEERQKTLTKEQKLKEERDAAIKEASDYKTKFEAAQVERVVEKQDMRMTRIAEKHLDPDYVESEFPRLAAALLKAAEEGDKKLAKNEEAWIDNWFKERVAEKPKLGKNFGKSDEGGEGAPPAKTVTLNNGAQDTRPNGAPRGANSGGVKTAKPGQPNSMSDKEIRDLGYQYK